VAGRRVLTADASGLHESGQGIDLSSSWSSILRVDDTPTHLFIYFSPQGAIVVPKRVGPELIDELSSELGKHRSVMGT
jgi:hypothetical protein